MALIFKLVSAMTTNSKNLVINELDQKDLINIK